MITGHDGMVQEARIHNLPLNVRKRQFQPGTRRFWQCVPEYRHGCYSRSIAAQKSGQGREPLPAPVFSGDCDQAMVSPNPEITTTWHKFGVKVMLPIAHKRQFFFG